MTKFTKGRHTYKKEQAHLRYLIKKYITLGQTKLTPKEFAKAVKCEVLLKKLQTKIGIE